jgi:hypothetical protein
LPKISSHFRLPDGDTGHDVRAGLVFFADIDRFSPAVILAAAAVGLQAG